MNLFLQYGGSSFQLIHVESEGRVERTFHFGAEIFDYELPGSAESSIEQMSGYGGVVTASCDYMQVEVSFPVKCGYVSREVGYFHLLAELLIGNIALAGGSFSRNFPTFAE